MFHTLDFEQCNDIVQKVQVYYGVGQDPQREIFLLLFCLSQAVIEFLRYLYGLRLGVREYRLRETELFA